ncbi:MAG: hypothetical protein WCG34_04365 [Leptolinea sp.]
MQKKKSNSHNLEALPDTQSKNGDMAVQNQPEEMAIKRITEAQPKKNPKKPSRKIALTENTELELESRPRQSEESDIVGDAEFKPAAAEKAALLRHRWLPFIGAATVGGLAGFLLSYFFLILPLQNQLTNIAETTSNGNSSSNQIKSDLSTTKLKQQEMETRYLSASDQLENANQYIFLLRMKEQIAIARLMVEQKEGYKARQSLSEIQSRFDHLKPFAVKKDTVAVKKMEELIKISIQHLVNDPESVKVDLTAISDQINRIELTLFQPE